MGNLRPAQAHGDTPLRHCDSQDAPASQHSCLRRDGIAAARTVPSWSQGLGRTPSSLPLHPAPAAQEPGDASSPLLRLGGGASMPAAPQAEQMAEVRQEVRRNGAPPRHTSQAPALFHTHPTPPPPPGVTEAQVGASNPLSRAPSPFHLGYSGTGWGHSSGKSGSQITAVGVEKPGHCP